MSTLEHEIIIIEDVCLLPQSIDRSSLLRETNLSFEEWWLNRTGEIPKQIAFEGTLRIDGYAAGLLRSDDGKLIVGETGTIDGDVDVNDAIIHGTVRGQIRATTSVELASSARVIGDIETGHLLIQPGAIFQGRCAFNSAASDAREAA